jgi:hypothetical protein
MKRLCLLLFLAGLGFGAAASYRVDSSGGPLTLNEEMTQAVLAWSRLAEGVDLVEDAAGDMEVRFAMSEPAGAGPDTVTLTLLHSAGPVRLTVLVNPLLYQSWPAALVHEAGIMLGLNPGAEGIMNPVLSSATPAAPEASDLAAFRLKQASVPGDLTGDGVVDWYDLLEVAARHDQRGVNLPGDLDGDGVITDQDLTLLRGNYEFLPPADTAPGAPAGPEEGVPAGQPDAADPGDQDR